MTIDNRTVLIIDDGPKMDNSFMTSPSQCRPLRRIEPISPEKCMRRILRNLSKCILNINLSRYSYQSKDLALWRSVSTGA